MRDVVQIAGHTLQCQNVMCHERTSTSPSWNAGVSLAVLCFPLLHRHTQLPTVLDTVLGGGGGGFLGASSNHYEALTPSRQQNKRDAKS